jgi:crotonobetainyl-CoA:carnitine CoA-transferase CaiB-like acyl-CoA transferase
MTRELEAAVRDHGGSRSPDKALRGQEIRELATDLAGQAQKVGLLVSALGTMAAALSDEAIRLAAIVMSWENTASGTPAQPADTVRLERHLTDFKRAALTVFYSGRAITNGPPIADELQRELAM